MPHQQKQGDAKDISDWNKDIGSKPSHQEPLVISERFQMGCFQTESCIKHEDRQENQKQRYLGSDSGEGEGAKRELSDRDLP